VVHVPCFRKREPRRPRRKNEIPAYLRHKARNCGKAVFGRVTVYFPGPWHSEQSRAAYRRAVAEWLTTGIAPRTTQPDQPDNTVNELLLAFWTEHVLKRYIKNGQPTSERRSFSVALHPVKLLYGLEPASDFTPKRLIACRQLLIDAGHTRKRIWVLVWCSFLLPTNQTGAWLPQHRMRDLRSRFGASPWIV
jgi:hypothetical protein